MRYFFMILMGMLVFSCGNPSDPAVEIDPRQQEEDKLLEDIHYLHDVATMPKMGSLVVLQKKLDALEGVEKTTIFDLKKGLKDADEMMMDWMVQFNWQSEQTPIDERIKYYAVEVEKLKKLETSMNVAISDAEKQLETKE
ncbi:MAG: hypothetical protein ACI94Y_001079 [Maribacter sp.]|jgi:hypothetical protein